MEISIHRGKVEGRLEAPPSKSETQRAYALAALADGQSTIKKPSESDDAQAALAIAQCLGVRVEINTEHVGIYPGEGKFREVWNANESGLSLRMFSAIAGLFDEDITLTGEKTLLTRPVGFISETLGRLGLTVSGARLPITIGGRLGPGRFEIDGGVSSQLVSGILIALPLLDGPSELTVNNIVSSRYIDLTLSMMRRFGVVVDRNGREFSITGKQRYRGTEMDIQGDWSGAAFLLVAGALAGDVELGGLEVPSLQPDSQILEVIRTAGGKVDVLENSVRVSKGDKLGAFDYDATGSPDLVPALAVLALGCAGTSVIRGIHRLRYKESDRLKAILEEFRTLGANLEHTGDSLHVTGGSLAGGSASSHGDHRIAMALSIAALVSAAPVRIAHAECVAKSYPGFYNDLVSLGMRIEKADQ